MLVYGHRTVRLNVAGFLRQCRERVDALPATPDHGAIIALLVDWGEAESAVADALLPYRDDDPPELAPWRAVSDACADAACASWENDPRSCLTAIAAVRDGLCKLETAAVPPLVQSKAAEGFAYYALYPEQYMEAAQRFATAHTPHSVLCLGLRSIGSILAHVVAATIRRRGIPAHARSVRPRGHPFERRLELTKRFSAALAHGGESHVAVVDEGPGLSGSSLAAAADFLVVNGRPDTRIVLFPSWQPSGDTLRSSAARAAWSRHAKLTAGFDEVCLRGDRLFGATRIVADLSAGAWRTWCYPSAEEWPAVQPQHERRKYLGPDETIRRFAGLGRRAAAIAHRASILGGSGFASGALSLDRGFLVQPWVNGRPLTSSVPITAVLMDRLASYVAFVKRAFPSTEAESIDDVQAMAVTNASQGLGSWTVGAIERLSTAARQFEEPRAAVDGRMLPHEWIAADERLVKMDALDHHDDDFWPGCRDIAWDVAGTIVEFDFSQQAASYFVNAYERESGDRTIGRRLPFYQCAYLCYRQGYAALAADTLGDSTEGRAFTALRQRYRRSLDAQLGRSRPA